MRQTTRTLRSVFGITFAIASVLLSVATADARVVYRRINHTLWARTDASQEDEYPEPKFCEGVAAVADCRGHFGYIDHAGRWAIPPTDSGVNDFDHGTAKVYFGKIAFDRAYWNVPLHRNGWDRSGEFEMFAK